MGSGPGQPSDFVTDIKRDAGGRRQGTSAILRYATRLGVHKIVRQNSRPCSTSQHHLGWAMSVAGDQTPSSRASTASAYSSRTGCRNNASIKVIDSTQDEEDMFTSARNCGTVARQELLNRRARRLDKILSRPIKTAESAVDHHTGRHRIRELPDRHNPDPPVSGQTTGRNTWIRTVRPA